MSLLQKIALGTPPTAVDGDTVRGANTKMNSNVDVLNTQTILTSNAAVITAAQSLTVAHVGKRVNVNLAAAGTINLPAASTCTADSVIHLRNVGATLVTLAITAGSGDTISLTTLAAGESAIMDTDGVHAWTCAMRGRSNSANEVVQGNCTVNGNETIGGTLAVTGVANLTAGMFARSGVTVYKPDNVTAAATMDLNGNIGCTGTVTSATLVTTATGTVGGAPIGTAPILSVTGTYPFCTRAAAAPAGTYWKFGGDAQGSFLIGNGSGTGAFIAAGGTSWAAASDERLKNIVAPLTNALAGVNSLRTVKYTLKADNAETPKQYVGFIAQDVRAVVPECVPTDVDGHLGVQYAELTVLLAAAIKELSQKLDAAQQQIDALKASST